MAGLPRSTVRGHDARRKRLRFSHTAAGTEDGRSRCGTHSRRHDWSWGEPGARGRRGPGAESARPVFLQHRPAGYQGRLRLVRQGLPRGKGPGAGHPCTRLRGAPTAPASRLLGSAGGARRAEGPLGCVGAGGPAPSHGLLLTDRRAGAANGSDCTPETDLLSYIYI